MRNVSRGGAGGDATAGCATESASIAVAASLSESGAAPVSATEPESDSAPNDARYFFSNASGTVTRAGPPLGRG
jgi:hypothetical protein